MSFKRMGKFKLLILIVFGLGLFLLLPQKAKAADTDVIINEVMANPSCTPPINSSCDSDLEWIELYNSGGESVDLSGWTIDSTTIPIGTKIPKEGFLVIARELIDSNADTDKDSFESFYGNNSGIWGDDPSEDYLAIDGSMVLNNDTLDSLTLDNQKSGIDNYQETFSWQKTEDGITWQRIPLTDDWALGYCGETPSAKNCVQVNHPPTNFELQLPKDESTLYKGSEFNFAWFASTDPEGEEVTYDFYISCNQNFNDNKFIDSAIEETNYFLEVDNVVKNYGTCERYYWKILAFDGILFSESTPFSFKITDQIYSNSIIINELYPDPASGEEWIEFYNNSAEQVNLKNWILEDEGLNRHAIAIDLFVEPFGYAKIFYSDSKITLNNDGDLIKLYNPNNQLVYTTPKYTTGDKGWSFARGPDGIWVWTTTPTAGELNIITSPATSGVGGSSVDEIKIPVNNEPVNIQTGEVENYRDYLVRISGEVTRTSGNTFYIDDGSGEVKVYIQEKTGIDKPEMHTGDTFEIFGIVNLYRGVFRILPQNQADIRLIESVKQILKTSSKSKVAASLAGSIKKVSAAENSLPTQASQKAKTSFWIQMLKVIIGLAIILLIIFLVKVFAIKKEHPIGYDFGNDET